MDIDKLKELSQSNNIDDIILLNQMIITNKDDVQHMLIESFRNNDMTLWLDVSQQINTFKNILYDKYNDQELLEWLNYQRTKNLSVEDKLKLFRQNLESVSGKRESPPTPETPTHKRKLHPVPGKAGVFSTLPPPKHKLKLKPSIEKSSETSSDTSIEKSSDTSIEKSSDTSSETSSDTSSDTSDVNGYIGGKINMRTNETYCDYFLRTQYTHKNISRTRKEIHRKMIKRTNGKANSVKTMNIGDIQAMYKLYDHYFFDGVVDKFLNKPGKIKYILEFEFGNTTHIGGICSKSVRGTQCSLKITLSKKALTNVFKDKSSATTEVVNGIVCRDQLECMQLIFEHELIHMIIGVWCDSKKGESHGKKFKTLANNIFGHTDFRHTMGQGLTEDPKIKMKKLQDTLEVGDKIRVYDKEKNVIIPYKVLKTNRREDARYISAQRLTDGATMKVSFSIILLPGEEIAGAKEEKVKVSSIPSSTHQTLDQQSHINNVQNYIRVGKEIRSKNSRTGQIERYRVKKVNNRSNAIYFIATKLADNKDYKVPLVSVII